jgi:hypothetical protein
MESNRDAPISIQQIARSTCVDDPTYSIANEMGDGSASALVDDFLGSIPIRQSLHTHLWRSRTFKTGLDRL